MSESFREQLERVTEMAHTSGDTWDLSLNDQEALQAVLERLSVLEAAYALGHREGYEQGKHETSR